MFKKLIPILPQIIASLFLAGFMVFLFFDQKPSPVQAGAGDNVSGWAWSNMDDSATTADERTIGWISFNCNNPELSAPRCVSPNNYGVNINSSTGNFSGYAWSENIGWINFEPSGSYPSLPNYSAKADLATGEVSGWARACVVFETECSGALNLNSGGWDGWIKMRKYSTDAGTDYGLSINKSNGEFSGYAWSDKVIGWMSFKGPSYGVKVEPVIFNSPPSITSGSLRTEALETAYCGVNPSHRFSWTFSDNDSGDSQTAYWLQIDNNSDFSSLTFDSGKQGSVSNPNSSQERFVNVSQSPGAGELGYGASYYWRVKVYDENDADSGWAVYQDNSGSAELFNTPAHHYPQPDFSWVGPKPVVNETVNFQDLTVFYVANQANRAWLWTMPVGSTYVYQAGTNQNSQNPKVKFSNFGDKKITLKAIDNELGGVGCSAQKTITTGISLPKLKEILPKF